ncbi:NADP-dependent oxidoreductase [Pontibacterium sp.]|uniref:NADP-dependent oxidoreductase n=1 Tax=Pontibacterium sp. TaxID=2036026 RepID=UPI0035154E1F
MRAIQIHEFGDTSNLKLEEVDTPVPQRGEVLIRTEACGINPIDWKTCAGGGAAPFIGELPFIPGWEFAGTVEEVGEGVSGYGRGDKVFGMIRFPERAGCYAEYIAAPAAEIAKRGDDLDSVTAAGIATAGLTAWQALFDKGSLQAGQRVLILGAAGGVGHLAVQLANWAGAEVYGTASGRNHSFLRSLGAHKLYDYHLDDVTQVLSDVDLIIDAVGGDTAINALPCLKPGGVMVTLPSVTKDQVIAAGDEIGHAVLPIRCEANADQLAELATLHREGKLRVALAEALPLEQVAEAFRLSQEGHVRGKLVLTL